MRSIAVSAGLHVADKKSSVGICFIENNKKISSNNNNNNAHNSNRSNKIDNKSNSRSHRFGDFLSSFICAESKVLLHGNFIDVDTNAIVGKHKGLLYYTYGQRARIPNNNYKNNTNGFNNNDAYYCCGKDVNNNIIYVCRGNKHAALFTSSVLVREMLWVDRNNNFKSDNKNYFECEYKARYLQPLKKCVVRRINNNDGKNDNSNTNKNDIENNFKFEQSVYTKYSQENQTMYDSNFTSDFNNNDLIVYFDEPARAVCLLKKPILF